MNRFAVTRLIALVMVVAVLAMISYFFIPVYAQAGGAQEESEGDLTVVINGETFTTGQSIIISGSVDDPGTSPPHIQIFDPVGTPIAQAFPNLSADNTFTFSLVAGENDDPMLLLKALWIEAATTEYLLLSSPVSQTWTKSTWNLSIS